MTQAPYLFDHIRDRPEPICFSKKILDRTEFTMEGTPSRDLNDIQRKITSWR
jgi:hypothetical protein